MNRHMKKTLFTGVISAGCFVLMVQLIVPSSPDVPTHVTRTDSNPDVTDVTNVTGPGTVTQKLSCIQRNMRYMRDQDLMKMAPLKFLKNLKNPCWVDHNQHLHCLPYMYIVGVAKCGTTDLFKRIGLHPDFVAPTDKEPGWLSARRFYGDMSLESYTDEFFKPLQNVLQNSQQGFQHLITGEASINTLEGSHYWYLYGRNVNQTEPLENNADYIYHLNPRARIIINVRNPVERLWSEYLAFSHDPHKTAEKFHQLVTDQINIYAECLQTRSLRSCMYDVQLGKYATMNQTERTTCKRQRQKDIVMLKRGVYHVFIRDFLKVFTRKQILIQRLEDVSDYMKESLRDTYYFLGLRPLDDDALNKILRMNVRNRRKTDNRQVGGMLTETRALLTDFYRPHNEALAKLLGSDRYNYDDPSTEPNL